jgi:hypothetical protein
MFIKVEAAELPTLNIVSISVVSATGHQAYSCYRIKKTTMLSDTTV